MSEPWGCIVDVKITTSALDKYLRSKQKNRNCEEFSQPNQQQLVSIDTSKSIAYFYAFNNKVYENRRDNYLELVGADPVTLREVLMLDLCVDKNNVYLDQITENRTLIKLDNVDDKTFQSTNHYGFAIDKNHVYFKGKILPLDVKSARLTVYGFAFDNNDVYYYFHPVELDGKTFKVLRYQSSLFSEPFIVSDKNGLYHYDTDSNINILKKSQELSPVDLDKIAQFKCMKSIFNLTIFSNFFSIDNLH
ncbi:DKNYY domain-containing protein [Orbus wheelerorum]|uniref:DKNYY domain-containing protein n=1 Tax=Orbus wheelerorum TaxID=3074111 RepID=UPI00370D214A